MLCKKRLIHYRDLIPSYNKSRFDAQAKIIWELILYCNMMVLQYDQSRNMNDQN